MRGVSGDADRAKGELVSDQAVRCGAKHTKPQIPDEAWKCPKCGATADSERAFVIQDTDEAASELCPILHAADEIGCDSCGFGSSGAAFARRYAKESGLVPCGNCKGTGMVTERAPKQRRTSE